MPYSAQNADSWAKGLLVWDIKCTEFTASRIIVVGMERAWNKG